MNDLEFARKAVQRIEHSLTGHCHSSQAMMKESLIRALHRLRHGAPMNRDDWAALLTIANFYSQTIDQRYLIARLLEHREQCSKMERTQ